MTAKKTESLQRALETAADFFTRHRLEDVSVVAIARAAHCSTTTIYEVWGSKEQLFVAAMTARLNQLEIPLPPSTCQSHLETLLAFALQRARTLSHPSVCEVWRAVLRQTELMRSEMTASLLRDRVGSDQLIERTLPLAIAEGSLRPANPRAIQAHFRAVTTYGTLFAELICAPSVQLSERDTVGYLFDPLVTERGRVLLDRFISALALPVCEASATEAVCSQ